MKKFRLLLAILIGSISVCLSQESQLLVNLSDGSTEAYNISEIQKITFSGLVGINEIEDVNAVLNSLKLFPNYPNPFSHLTTIKYETYEKAYVMLNIYDNKGGLVRKLFSGSQDEGTHTIEWDGKNDNKQRVTTGLYFCQLILNNKMDSKQMIFINK